MLTFQRLTPETVDDFLYFFDHDAFSEDDEWANCYCLEGHLAGEKSIFDPAVRREHAKRLVLEGKLTGYLLRDGSRMIGWVKAGDRCDFVDPDQMFSLSPKPQGYGEVMVLYCIDLVPEYRGQGVARQILQKVTEDARLAGYKYLEVYPSADKHEKRNYRGHSGMYEAAGFEYVHIGEEAATMRLTLNQE